ncbi:MAG: alpha-hydroxy acid oxidase [Hyphomonadaceae bacterium]
MNLSSARNIADLRALAKRRLPLMVFDYIDGAADDEITNRRNESRFRDIELNFDVLVDVAEIDTTASIMGAPMRLPFFISPTAASRLFHIRGGERAVARAAQRAGVVYCCSSIASTSVEDIAAAHEGPRWFQMYVWRDRELVKQMLARAKAAGFTGLILTVDTPLAGNRERDPKNRFTIPPRVNWNNAINTLARPAYLWDLVTTPSIGPANFAHIQSDGGVMELINRQFDRSVTWADAQWMREQWGGPFAAKGVCTPADARRCIDIGASAVWVSNHGGRQLDTAPATIDALPAIADAVRGEAEIILDGGVRRGTDIVKALALGADAVALGRAYLWGLAAGGEAGVARALEILEAELRRAMALMGRRRIADITRDAIFVRR